jgi:cytochrome d ubiquinol oxidase subunit II
LFLALKTEGRVRERAVGLVRRGGLAVVVVGGAFLVWTELAYGAGWTIVSVLAAAGALLGALWLVNRRDGWAFALTAIAIIAVTVTLFGSLYPDVLPSSTDPANSLNTTNAASTAYTLTIMTWVAVVFTPIVLAYQSWTFWVFRRRITASQIPPSTGLPVGVRTGSSR